MVQFASSRLLYAGLTATHISLRTIQPHALMVPFVCILPHTGQLRTTTSLQTAGSLR